MSALPRRPFGPALRILALTAVIWHNDHHGRLRRSLTDYDH